MSFNAALGMCLALVVFVDGESARVLTVDTVGRAAPDVLDELGDVSVRHVDVPTLVKLAEALLNLGTKGGQFGGRHSEVLPRFRHDGLRGRKRSGRGGELGGHVLK